MSNAYVSAGFRNKDTDSAINGLASGIGGVNINGGGGGGNACACGCGKSVSPRDRQLTINGQTWLTKCFKCESCDLAIDIRQDGGYVMKKGQTWCQKCDKYDARLNNDHSGQFVKVGGQNQGPSVEDAWGVSSSKYVPDSSPAGGRGSSSSGFSVGKSTSNGANGSGGPPPVPREARSSNGSSSQIQNRLDQGKEFCCVCNNPIQGTGYGAKGRWYHPECFKCGKCGQLITDQRFVSDGGEVYHPKCAPPRGPPCTGCGEPLVGTYRIFQDNKYHAQCLVCGGCRGSLDGGYILKGSDPYCRECVMNPGSRPAGGGGAASSRSVPTGGTTSGIQFDHQTRQAHSTSGGPPPASAAAAGGPPPPPAAATGKIPKFCGTCGAKTNADGKFCGECGQSFFG